MTIRLRLAALFGAAALVLLVGGSALFVTQLKAGLDKSLTLTLSTRADNILAVLAATSQSLPGRPRPALRGNVLRIGPSGTYAQLLTPSGALISGSRSLAADSLLSTSELRVARHRSLVLDRTVQLTEPEEDRSVAMRLLTRTLHPSGDVLIVAVSREVVDQAVSKAKQQLILLGIAVLALAGPGAWLLTGAALWPVERMRREVRQIEARNAAVGLKVPNTHDEIARLAETFNVVLARMHAAVAREQALVADAGHELRTPLTVLKGELELARRPQRTRDELAEAVEVAAEETERLVRLTEDLLFISRQDADAGNRPLDHRFDVVAVAERAADAMAAPAAERGIRIVVDGAGPVCCLGNPDWIRRAVDNLLANALRYAPAGSTVTVQVAEEAGEVGLSVADEGPGFPPEFLPIAFDRFSRADNSRVRAGTGDSEAGGSGLGLAIVRAIVARHGGTATAGNRPEGGAEVRLRWPCG